MISVNRGLGKHSPIKLRLNRDNYHALIQRHGQSVRWMKASPCTCVMANNRPNPNCTVCSGDGWRYDHPRESREIAFARVVGENKIALPQEYRPRVVSSVFDTFGLEYEVVSVDGREITIDGSRVPAHYEMLEVAFEHSFERTETVTGTYVGNGVIEVPIKGFLTAVAGVEALRVLDNRVFIAEDPEPSATYELSVTYVEPLLFVLVNQTTRRVDQQWLHEVGGDAIVSFPAGHDVGMNDVITPLTAQTIDRVVLSKRPGTFDMLPVFYVKAIRKIEGADRVYLPGVDFVQWGRNEIKWTGSDRPADRSTIVVEYAYSPTYRVLTEQPNIRSSENQLLPRRVAVKLLTGRTRREGI